MIFFQRTPSLKIYPHTLWFWRQHMQWWNTLLTGTCLVSKLLHHLLHYYISPSQTPLPGWQSTERILCCSSWVLLHSDSKDLLPHALWHRTSHGRIIKEVVCRGNERKCSKHEKPICTNASQQCGFPASLWLLPCWCNSQKSFLPLATSAFQQSNKKLGFFSLIYFHIRKWGQRSLRSIRRIWWWFMRGRSQKKM